MHPNPNARMACGPHSPFFPPLQRHKKGTLSPLLYRSATLLKFRNFDQNQALIGVILVREGGSQNPRSVVTWECTLYESIHITNCVCCVKSGWQSGAVGELNSQHK